MRKRLNVLACAVAALAVLVASGCGGGTSSSGTTAANGRLSGTLTVAAWDTGAPGDPLDQAAKDFEAANPGVRVKLKKTAFLQYEDGLRRQLNAGQIPDVARVVVGYGGPVTALTLGAKGLLADLSDQPWVQDLPQSASFTTNVGDKTYAMPVDIGAIGMIYDTALARRLGVTVPQTFSDTLALCRRLAGTDTKAFAMGAQEGSEMPGFAVWALAASSVYAADPDWGKQRLDDSVKFAGSGWQKAIDGLQQMRAAGCWDSDAVGISQEAASGAVVTGRALFAVAPTVTLPLFLGANPRAALLIAPFPGSDEAAQQRVPASPVDGLVIPAKAPNADLAKAFVAMYEQNRIRYSELDSSIPAIPPASGRTRLPPYATPLAPFFDGDKTTVIPDAQWPSPEVKTQYTTGLVQLLLGQRDGGQVLSAMDDAWTSEP